MKTTLIASTDKLAISVKDMKTYARITHNDDDFLLESLIKTATAWVEEATGKTLLEKTWCYRHSNQVLSLPHAPIIKVLEVKAGQKILPSSAYTFDEARRTVTLNTSSARKTNSVTYTAGFGTTPQELPETLKKAVMSTVCYVYEHRYDLTPQQSVYQAAQPWIHHHRTYQMV